MLQWPEHEKFIQHLALKTLLKYFQILFWDVFVSGDTSDARYRKS